jgi:hypothetical protein
LEQTGQQFLDAFRSEPVPERAGYFYLAAAWQFRIVPRHDCACNHAIVVMQACHPVLDSRGRLIKSPIAFVSSR